MALYNAYTLKSGDASDPTVWFVALQATPTVQVAGVVPNNGADLFRVLIDTGHVVTLDGVYRWGDDSTSARTVNAVNTTSATYVAGAIKASRVISSALTCQGVLAVTLTGELDFGTEESPIPADVSAEILVNFSAAPANSKYALTSTLGSQGVRFYGAQKDAYTSIVSDILASAVIVPTANNAGWRVGDLVAFGKLSVPDTTRVVRTITEVTPTNITVDLPIGTDSPTGRKIVNLTRNVKIKSALGYSATFFITAHPSGPDGYIEYGNVELGIIAANAGSAALGGFLNSALTIATSSLKVKRAKNLVMNPVYSYVAGTPTYHTGVVSIGFANTVGQSGFVVDGLSGLSINTLADVRSNAKVTIKNIAIIGTASTNQVTLTGTGGGVPGNIRVEGGWIEGGPQLANGAYSPMAFKNVDIDGLTRMLNTPQMRGPAEFIGCTIGQRIGVGAGSSVVFVENSSYPVVFDRCTMMEGSISVTDAALAIASASAEVRVRNRNNDIEQQERYTHGGQQVRDNTVKYRGRSSMRFDCWHAENPLTYSFTIQAASGQEVILRGAMRYNEAYGTGTPPTVTMSADDILPVSVACPTTTSDAWQPYTVAITNTLPFATEITVTYSGQSAYDTPGAYCWFDGITDSPWVQWSRHYGYLFDSNASSIVDPVTQLPIEVAAALSGISLVSGTLTITESRTIREIYDWVQWYECANLLDPVLKSTDGANFTLTANFIIDGGAITGNGAISMPAHTLTTLNGGGSALPITHNAGTSTAISVTGIVDGSRVQLYNVTDGVELYNGIPGTSLSLLKVWTTDLTIRARVTYCLGLAAKLPWTQTGIFTSSGLGVLVSQVNDSVYITNGINGDLVTEFVADFPNVQIDVSDPDGITTPQRGYAWFISEQQTAAGIANFFGGMTAEDTVNYRIESGILDMKIQNISNLPCVIAGARIYRADGASIFAVGTGPIQSDPSKSYVAGASGIAESVAAQLSIPTATENANAIWNSTQTNFNEPGTFGKFVNSLLSVSKFLGLK